MNKYSNRMSKPMERSYLNRAIHPVWRGVGCAMMVLIPVMSYFTGLAFLDENARQRWINIPAEWYIQSIAGHYMPDPAILIKIGATIVFTLIMYAVFTMFAFLIYKLFAPSRYGPLDVPPVTYKGRSYKR